MTEAEIHRIATQIRLDAWDQLSAEDRMRASLAEENRPAARRSFALLPDDPVAKYVFALDQADEFVALARRGYAEASALTLSPMEPRILWAQIRREVQSRGAAS